MAKTWTMTTSNSNKRPVMDGDTSLNNSIWLDNAWNELSPTQAATLPTGTKMLDANDKELTLLDGYCTTYFYKGWQTAVPMQDGKIGNIITNEGFGNKYGISNAVGPTVANIYKHVQDMGDRYLQIVRLPDGVIALPTNVGKNLISDLYPGIMWGTNITNAKKNWYNQWDITPLAPGNFSISDQLTDLPRSCAIDETNIPGYGTDTNKSFYAPELFTPYMYLRNQEPADGIFVGGIIVVMGVKKLSSGAKNMPFDEEAESDSTDNESVIEGDSTEIQQAEALNDNVEDKELS